MTLPRTLTAPQYQSTNFRLKFSFRQHMLNIMNYHLKKRLKIHRRSLKLQKSELDADLNNSFFFILFLIEICDKNKSSFFKLVLTLMTGIRLGLSE